MPLSNAALVGVEPHDAGAASALVNATQQVGGALGTALFNTIYRGAVTAFVAANGTGAAVVAQSLIHGYVRAFIWAAVAMLVAASVVIVLVRGGKQPAGDSADEYGRRLSRGGRLLSDPAQPRRAATASARSPSTVTVVSQSRQASVTDRP